MRLIDADALRRKVHCAYSDDLGICEMIDNQPTAYDVKKVVQQLKEEKDEYERLERGSNYEGYNLEEIEYSAKVEAFKEAIEIVRNGGKE